jgi:hypothetical protein
MSFIKKEDLLNNENISEGFMTIPNPETKRFVIKIPKIDEKYLDDTSHVVDYKGRPTGIEKGIIFHNGIDKTDQLVKGDGTGILIINNVTKEQSIILTEMEKALSSLPSQLYVKGFKELINECNDIGLIDKYNSNIEYMNSNLIKDPDSNTYVRTNDSMIAHISNEYMVIEGADGTSISIRDWDQDEISYMHDGPSYINFIGHEVNKGDIILETKDGGFRKIDRNVFKETYLDLDGKKFNEDTLNDLASRELNTTSRDFK